MLTSVHLLGELVLEKNELFELEDEILEEMFIISSLEVVAICHVVVVMKAEQDAKLLFGRTMKLTKVSRVLKLLDVVCSLFEQVVNHVQKFRGLDRGFKA